MCAVDRWHEFLEWARDRVKKRGDIYFLGMGDYDDLSSTSEREILRSNKLHDSTIYTLNGLYEENCNRLYREIDFMKGRLIGLIEGNHFSQFDSGITTTQMLCEKMQCKYLGVSSFIRLNLVYSTTYRQTLDVWAHHGLSGGRTVGASIGKLENMAKMSDARINLMGHDHRKQIAFQRKFSLIDSHHGKLTVEDQKILLARTGSFLKGYEDGRPSYVADACLPPTDLGVVKIEITPHRSCFKNKLNGKGDSRWIDIHATI